MRSLCTIAVWFLLVLPASVGRADPTVEVLLSLKADGMNEGDRLQNSSYCLAAGRQARENGKFGIALDLFTKCLELNSEETRAHLEKGLLFGDERVVLRTRAISELLFFLAADPTDIHARTELGGQYMRLGRIAEAEEQFKMAVARDPGDPYPLGMYGILLIDFTDKVQKGVELERAAIAGIPDEPWFRMNLAWGYVLLGRYAEARAAAAAAITAIRKSDWGQPAVDEMNQLLRSIEGK